MHYLVKSVTFIYYFRHPLFSSRLVRYAQEVSGHHTHFFRLQTQFDDAAAARTGTGATSEQGEGVRGGETEGGHRLPAFQPGTEREQYRCTESEGPAAQCQDVGQRFWKNERKRNTQRRGRRSGDGAGSVGGGEEQVRSKAEGLPLIRRSRGRTQTELLLFLKRWVRT